MQLFEKIKINLKCGKSRQIRFLGIPVIQYDRIQGKVKYYLPFIKRKETEKRENVFYLKINLDRYYTYINFQHWINIINELNADYYILCDNKILEQNILKRIVFRDSDIKFIRSRKKEVKKYINNIATERWHNAGCAHLTTFLHAKENNIPKFWNIDADDTTISLPANKVAKVLKQAEKYADNNQISLFSLDMWSSRTYNRHWSFGCTYTKDTDKFIEICRSVKNNDWMKGYFQYGNGLNIDWFVTYLRDTNQIKAKSFYPDKTYFLHWARNGEFIVNLLGAFCCYWENDKIVFPIISSVYKKDFMGILPISRDCIKIETENSLSESLEFLFGSITFIKKTPLNMIKFYKIEQILK